MRSLLQEKQQYYPVQRAEVIPTRLGNIIAAFEGYAYHHYGMDAIYLWPRLAPVLQSEGYAPFVEQEKAAFDFLVNLGFVSWMVGVELAPLLILNSQCIPAVVSLVCASAIAYGFYLASHNAAIHWGARVMSAFDLYRETLREMLQIRKPVGFDDERKLWQRLSAFYRSADQRFEEFSYYRQTLPIVIGERASIEVTRVIIDENTEKTRFALILRNVQPDKPVEQTQVIDFVETGMQPCDVTISDPNAGITHCHLDGWANAYKWIAGPIPGGSTLIVSYSLCALEAEEIASETKEQMSKAQA
jgi:hypothetical protein